MSKIIVLLLTLVLTACGPSEWDIYKVEHHCKVTQKKDGDSGVGITTNGSVVMTSTSSQTGWLCDDGITYWKNS